MEPRQVIIVTEDSPQMQRARQEEERLNNSSRSPRMRILARVSNNSMRRSPPAPPMRMSHDRSHNIDYSSGSSVNSGHLVSSPIGMNSLDYGFGGPFMPPQSSPLANVSLPSHHETFGSQIDYNLSWMPRDIHLSDQLDISSILREQAQGLRLPDRYLQKDLNITEDSKMFDQSSSLDSRYLLNRSPIRETDDIDANEHPLKKESLMEWFDRTVEKELQKRRDGLFSGENIVNLESPSLLSVVKSQESIIADAHTSNLDIAADLRQEQQTEMLEAVDKLAKAEAMCMFEGAVKAAEKAAAAAPPEYAEEAAAAGAQDFQAEITNTIKQEIPGIKPIEVIGYVGITRPKKPKKSNFSGI